MKPQKETKETEKHMAKWKKSTWKGFILYNSNYTKSWKGKTVETIKRSVIITHLWWGTNEWVEPRGLLGQLNHSAWYCNGGYM